jgi:hypothetical protein
MPVILEEIILRILMSGKKLITTSGLISFKQRHSEVILENVFRIPENQLGDLFDIPSFL